MKIVKHDGHFKVIDSMEREVFLTKPLMSLDDIFSASWVGKPSKGFLSNYVALTDECSSFKGLKHEVAGYLLVNEIEADIPKRYISAYNMNKHLYCKTETIYE